MHWSFTLVTAGRIKSVKKMELKVLSSYLANANDILPHEPHTTDGSHFNF
jgi:hypothetical protein